jgi:glutathione S-transferase
VRFSEDVERQRRAHRNDLENIPVFFIIAFLYILTSPSEFIAVNLIRAFAIGRIVHTLVYAVIPMQPARAIAFFVGVGVTIYMAINVAIFFY